MNRSIEQQACLPKKKDESCLKSTMYGAEGIEKSINSGTQRGEGKVLTYFSLQPRSERALRFHVKSHFKIVNCFSSLM